jgi:hypothetical protein
MMLGTDWGCAIMRRSSTPRELANTGGSTKAPASATVEPNTTVAAAVAMPNHRRSEIWRTSDTIGIVCASRRDVAFAGPDTKRIASRLTSVSQVHLHIAAIGPIKLSEPSRKTRNVRSLSRDHLFDPPHEQHIVVGTAGKSVTRKHRSRARRPAIVALSELRYAARQLAFGDSSDAAQIHPP